MRKPILFSLFILFILLAVSPAKASQPFLASPNEVITLINQYRQQNGVPALSYNSLLANLAQSQSNYQAEISTITHTGPGGTTPQERAAAAGYGDGSWFYLSEIIYGGLNATPSAALTWWKNSSLHNSIMLDPKYTEIGAGVATDGQSIYFTAELGGPTGGASTNPTQPPSDSGENPAPTDPSSVVVPVVRSTPDPDGSVWHVVQQGQTLWTIAAIYETTSETIIGQNQLDSTYIFPGDNLLIIPPSEAKIIKPTDTPGTSKPSVSAELTIAPTDEDYTKPRIGTPFSLVLDIPTATPEQMDTPEPQASDASLSESTSDTTMVDTLLIATVIILALVVLVSSLMQDKPSRPDRDDPVR